MYALVVELLDPLTIFFGALGAAGVYVWWRQPEARRALRWPLAVFVVAWLTLTPAIIYWPAYVFERAFPAVAQMPSEVDAIVVLSAGVYPPTKLEPQTRADDATLRRCATAARLYHQRPTIVFVSGGRVDPRQPGDSLAETMRQTLLAMGVAATDIVMEDQATDTVENAALTKQLLVERGLKQVALVTDGSHLFRACRLFERQGVAVIPVAANYDTSRVRGTLDNYLPSTGGAQISNALFHECVGLAWNKMRGRL
jgi:uncharacterized SAM-binding protein YcdF (DUF218 family)